MHLGAGEDRLQMERLPCGAGLGVDGGESGGHRVARSLALEEEHGEPARGFDVL